jgi:hypothetical protein
MIMATFRDQALSAYSIGSTPPTVTWTVVKGDTAAFRVYVTDDNKNPLTIADWDIEMEIKRPTVPGNIDSNIAAHVVTLFPEAEIGDGSGEFTVSLTSAESRSLNTGDIFDIELRDATRVWTVARGTMIIVEDITNNEES